MKILVDSDWILELLVNRHQYGKEAEKLLKILDEQSQAQVYATELCLDKINSFLGKEDPQLGRDAVSWVKDLLNGRILPFNNSIRDLASNLLIKDFESAVEVAVAKQENIGAIITLNPEIFTDANLSILSAEQFAKRVCLEQKLYETNFPTVVEANSKTIEKLNRLLKIETSNLDNLESINSKKFFKSNSINIKYALDNIDLIKKSFSSEFHTELSYDLKNKKDRIIIIILGSKKPYIDPEKIVNHVKEAIFNKKAKNLSNKNFEIKYICLKFEDNDTLIQFSLKNIDDINDILKTYTTNIEQTQLRKWIDSIYCFK